MGFTAIDNDLLDNQDLNIQEQSLLIAIISFMGKGNANPGYKTLKLRSKIKKDETLIKTINSLEKKEFIRIDRGKGKSNIYRLTDKSNNLYINNNYTASIIPTANKPTPKTEYPRKRSTSENGGEPTPKTEVLPTPKTEYENKSIKIKEKKNSAHLHNAQNAHKLVEELWKIYPLKKNKARAITKIPNLIKQYGFEQMKNTIVRYKQYVEETRNGGFSQLKYQNGSTFFNGSYVDYLDENYQKENDTVNFENDRERTIET